MTRTDDVRIGWSRADGRVWGTYLHGVFDADTVRRSSINRLRGRIGLKALAPATVYDLKAALDRLAGIVRTSLDMERIYRLLR